MDCLTFRKRDVTIPLFSAKFMHSSMQPFSHWRSHSSGRPSKRLQDTYKFVYAYLREYAKYVEQNV